METASEVLLIIVSSVLAVFLILACIATILLIRTLKKVNEMTDKVESTAETIRNTATAVPFVRLAMKLMDWSKKRRR